MRDSAHGRFSDHLRDFLRRESPVVRTIRIPRRQDVYRTGDEDQMIYFIESGEVKLVMPSEEGKEFLLDVMVAGDVFGESCLTGRAERAETATAMGKTVLRAMSAADLLPFLRHHSLYDAFVRHLATRIATLEALAARLGTMNSERRLAESLLRLARKAAPGSDTVTLPYRVSHEELAQMVGTTRPRVSAFMSQFQKDGLLENTPDRMLLVNVKKILDFLGR